MAKGEARLLRHLHLVVQDREDDLVQAADAEQQPHIFISQHQLQTV